MKILEEVTIVLSVKEQEAFSTVCRIMKNMSETSYAICDLDSYDRLDLISYLGNVHPNKETFEKRNGIKLKIKEEN